MYKYEKIFKGTKEDIENGFLRLSINDLEDFDQYINPTEIKEFKNLKLEIKIKKFYFYLDFEN